MDLKRITLCLALLCGFANAQFIGYVSAQSTAQVAFTNQAANGVTSTFNNIGQSSHFLTYCPSNFVGTLSAEGSTDGTFGNPVQLAAANYNTATSKCRVLPIGGYYPAVRARVSNYVSGTISATYTGIAAPVSVTNAAVDSNGPTSPIQCDQSATLVLSSGNQLLVTSTSNQNIWICGISIGQSSTGGTGAIFQLQSGTGATCTGSPTAIWATAWVTGTLSPVFFGGSLGAMLKVPPNLNVCTNLAGTTANFYITISYAQGFPSP